MTPEERTDLGNAKRFTRLFGERVRYVPQMNRFLVWDGTRYRADEMMESDRLAKATSLSILEEAAAADTTTDSQLLARWAATSQGEPALRRMLTLVRSEPGITVSASALDAHPMLFNVLNGTLDLSSGKLRPHDRTGLHTKRSDVRWDKTATCPRFQAYLEKVFAGDQELIGFVQRAAGYSLTGDTSEQALFLTYGLGANGKTVWLEILRRLLGDYAVRADFRSFTEQRGDGPRNDLARLAGARVAYASEVRQDQRFDEALIKVLTGGDPITTRFLYAEHFTYTPSFKLWLAANHRPTIRGTDNAVWRRIRLIPFTVTIPEHERDPYLIETLAGELPGILRWAVDGCLAWGEKRLGLATAVTAATAEYRDDSDVLAAFLSDRCVACENATVKAKDLYGAYRQWAEENQEEPISARTFGARLRERGLAPYRTKSSRCWKGLRLVTVTEGDVDSANPQMNSLVETLGKAASPNVIASSVTGTNVDYETIERIGIATEGA